VGEDDVFFFSTWDDGPEAMLHQIWNLLDQADAVLHYNGKRFDIPYINTEFAQAGMLPPSPYAQIDLYKAVRKQFNFMSNSLDSVSRALGTAHKLSHEGFSLWTKVMDGDKQAQCKMEEYNCGDLFANEDLYHRILPWIPAHPSYAVIDRRNVSGEDTGLVCPQCGSPSVEPSGRACTALSVYPRYKCTDCGKWLRGAHRLAGADLRTIS
jgi:DNA-directed RNA polymerase subunit RPC12/RpoP